MTGFKREKEREREREREREERKKERDEDRQRKLIFYHLYRYSENEILDRTKIGEDKSAFSSAGEGNYIYIIL